MKEEQQIVEHRNSKDTNFDSFDDLHSFLAEKSTELSESKIKELIKTLCFTNDEFNDIKNFEDKIPTKFKTIVLEDTLSQFNYLIETDKELKRIQKKSLEFTFDYKELYFLYKSILTVRTYLVSNEINNNKELRIFKEFITKKEYSSWFLDKVKSEPQYFYFLFYTILNKFENDFNDEDIEKFFNLANNFVQRVYDEEEFIPFNNFIELRKSTRECYDGMYLLNIYKDIEVLPVRKKDVKFLKSTSSLISAEGAKAGIDAPPLETNSFNLALEDTSFLKYCTSDYMFHKRTKEKDKMFFSFLSSYIYFIISDLVFSDGDSAKITKTIKYIDRVWNENPKIAEQCFETYNFEKDEIVIYPFYNQNELIIIRKILAIIDLAKNINKPKIIEDLLFKILKINKKEISELKEIFRNGFNEEEIKEKFYSGRIFYSLYILSFLKTSDRIFKVVNSTIINIFDDLKIEEFWNEYQEYEKEFNDIEECENYFDIIKEKTNEIKKDTEETKGVIFKNTYFFNKMNNNYSRPVIKISEEDLLNVHYSLKEFEKNDKDLVENHHKALIDLLLSNILKKNNDLFYKQLEKDKNYLDKTEKERLKKEISELKKENDEYKEVIDKLKDENLKNREIEISENNKENIIKELKEAESIYKKRIEQLEDEIRNSKLELKNKQNIIKSLEENCDNDSDENINLAEIIENNRIVIAGGRSDTRNRLEQKYPNNITGVDGTKFDKNLLITADIVVYLYKFSGHDLFEKIQNTIPTEKITYCHYNNVDKIENVIIKAIKNNSK